MAAEVRAFKLTNTTESARRSAAVRLQVSVQRGQHHGSQGKSDFVFREEQLFPKTSTKILRI